MIDLEPVHSQTGALEQRDDRSLRVGECDRTAGLSLGMACDQGVEIPKVAFAVTENDLARPSMSGGCKPLP